MPNLHRQTACVLIRKRARAIVIDVGTGAHRLVTDPSLLHGVDRLDVLLTHFHLDHVCGLPYLSALDLRPVIWGPGDWLYNRRTESIIRDLMRPPLSASREDQLEVRELSAGDQWIGPFIVRVREQVRHWAPSVGIRIDDFLAVVTDTGYDSGSVELAAGAGLLLHEGWSTSMAPISADMDSTGADAGRVAAAAGVARLALIHLNPALVDATEVLTDAQRYYASAELGIDGQSFSERWTEPLV